MFTDEMSPGLYQEFNRRGFQIKDSDGEVSRGESIELRDDIFRVTFDTGFKDFPIDTPVSMENEEFIIMPEHSSVEYALSLLPQESE